MSTYVSIGRNVGGFPMSDDKWSDFCSRTHRAVKEFTGKVYSSALGEGEYEGQNEECYIVVGNTPATDTQAAALRTALRGLAAHFEQECIALTIGYPEFIEPR